MSKSAKDTLLSVIVLVAITVVCVAILSVANEFLKYEVTLDVNTAKQLYSVCPTGQATDADAIEYFELCSIDDTIESVNKKYGDVNTKILAVYRATKGTNKGKYIIQAQAKGYVGPVVMLTAYNNDGTIMKTKCIEQSESFWSKLEDGNLTGFDGAVGKEGTVNHTDIAVGSGATFSVKAVATALTISNRMAVTVLSDGADDGTEVMTAETAKQLYLVCPTGQATDADALGYFEVVMADNEMAEVNEAYGDENTSVMSVYRASEGINSGTYIVKAKVSDYAGPIVMLTSYYADGTVMKTTAIEQHESYWDQVVVGDELDGFEMLIGKDGELTADDIKVNSGATSTLTNVAKVVTLSNKMAEKLLIIDKERTLTEDMAKALYAFRPTGAADDGTALEYFEIANVYAHISRVNMEHKDTECMVVTVYRTVKGDNKGEIIIKARVAAQGYAGPLVMLTAYNADGTVKKTKCIQQSEGYWNVLEDQNLTGFEGFIGKDGVVTPDDIMTNSGATGTLTKISNVISVSNALAKLIVPEDYEVLTAETASLLYSVCPTGEADDSNAIDFFEIVEMNSIKDAINEKYGNARFAVITVYRAKQGANAGTYIIKTRAAAQGYSGPLVMLTAYNADGTIKKTKCVQQSEGYWSVLEDQNLTGFEGFIGKDGVVTPDDIMTNSGATGTLTTVSTAVSLANRTMAAIIGG